MRLGGGDAFNFVEVFVEIDNNTFVDRTARHVGAGRTRSQRQHWQIPFVLSSQLYQQLHVFAVPGADDELRLNLEQGSIVAIKLPRSIAVIHLTLETGVQQCLFELIHVLSLSIR